jgi:hypothetical protein
MRSYKKKKLEEADEPMRAILYRISLRNLIRGTRTLNLKNQKRQLQLNQNKQMTLLMNTMKTSLHQTLTMKSMTCFTRRVMSILVTENELRMIFYMIVILS